MRSLLEDAKATVDLSVVLMIGIAFAALMVVAYIIWTIQSQLGATGNAALSIGNVTTGFDNAVNLLLVAITIFILAIAISALLMLRGR
jgi:membrane-anchored glycerophosphoryl diester phosphodiesterase (GDPDase)